MSLRSRFDLQENKTSAQKEVRVIHQTAIICTGRSAACLSQTLQSEFCIAKLYKNFDKLIALQVHYSFVSPFVPYTLLQLARFLPSFSASNRKSYLNRVNWVIILYAFRLFVYLQIRCTARQKKENLPKTLANGRTP